MVVPLRNIFAQCPPIAAVYQLIVDNVERGNQLGVLEAVRTHFDDRFRDDILRQVVKVCEARGIEVDPDVWEAYYELKSPAKLMAMRREADAERVVRYDLAVGKLIEIKENRNSLVQAGNTGHRTWESSLALTEYVCSHTSELDAVETVIELGAGTGLVSLALAKLGLVPEIIATDGSGLVIDRLNATIDRNAVRGTVCTQIYDWSDLEAAQGLPKGSFVMAGDILYGEVSLYADILDLLALLQPQKVWLCNPIRNEESYNEFKRLCEERNVHIEVLARFECKSADESDYMYLVSYPPIPVELVSLTF